MLGIFQTDIDTYNERIGMTIGWVIGAVLLILSLTVNRNLPSMVLESVWAIVALFGLGKALISRSRA